MATQKPAHLHAVPPSTDPTGPLFLLRLAAEPGGVDLAEALHWGRFFTVDGVSPLNTVGWKVVDARICSPSGEVVFEQLGVEVPEFWGETATNIAADKYFRVVNGVREHSFKQVLTRVCGRLREWGEDQGFFRTAEDGRAFEEELTYALLHQYGAFNSPVWFNLGVPGRTQSASACYIQGVGDSLQSIMEFQAAELRIFASGSGSGANLSNLRSSYERLSTGGYVSGPLAFMRGLDQYAAAMRSGGSTRASAKMVVLDVDHPDILETRDGRPGFLRCKGVEEQRARDLVAVGYSTEFDDPNSAQRSVAYQNANHSVRLPDAFMRAVEEDGPWETRTRDDRRDVVHTYRARDLWREIARAAWECGDPGVQFSDTINRWHTTPVDGEILSTNPCGEFTHVDDTSCNLCAVNSKAFYRSGTFSEGAFAHAVRLFSTAQMMIVGRAEYPTERITARTRALRPIGINLGNLGALLCSLGVGYDSDRGRFLAGLLSSMMTGYTYLNAAALAACLGPFAAYERNREPMLAVMRKHRDAASRIGLDPRLWHAVLQCGDAHGFYISQASLMAPLGTVSYLMGASTTGIEPIFSLVSTKSMVGGGVVRLATPEVRDALSLLGYPPGAAERILAHVRDTGGVEGADDLSPDDLGVFDCAVPPRPGGRCLSPEAHLAMMAAIQPHITCAQSKTVNLPTDTSVETIGDLLLAGWRAGLKCIAVYRDGCKVVQPLASSGGTPAVPEAASPSPRPTRRRLPDDVDSGWRHRFSIGGFKGYILVSEHGDGTPGEVFLHLGKTGSTTAGLMDGFTKLLSIALQYGVPLEHLVEGFQGMRFEPAGFTKNPRIRNTSSLLDYLFRLLADRYLTTRQPEEVAPTLPDPVSGIDFPACTRCGSLTVRAGACFVCPTCGTSSGCS